MRLRHYDYQINTIYKQGHTQRTGYDHTGFAYEKVHFRIQNVTYSSCEDAARLSFVLPQDAPADNRVLCKRAAKDQPLL